jgi:membrane complex biogenesis BtpA family protein
MSWLKEVFGRDKVVIGMVNCPPMPGTAWYDEKAGLPFITKRVEHDLLALQEGGVDGVLFHNENDRPFVTDIGPEIVATMTRAITQVLPQVKVPFGVDVLADTSAALAIALATGAVFVRDDMGSWINNAGELLRYRRKIGANHIKLLFTINADVLVGRELAIVAHTAPGYYGADAVSVAYLGTPDREVTVPETKEVLAGGHVPHVGVRLSDLALVKKVAAIPVFVNVGSRVENVAQELAVADGVIVGTDLKVDRITWNPVDPERVRAYMQVVNTVEGR